jgi:hypothetical protein
VVARFSHRRQEAPARPAGAVADRQTGRGVPTPKKEKPPITGAVSNDPPVADLGFAIGAAAGAEVRIKDGQRSVVDGPFVEAKEVWLR